jgi:hypothetical protein
VRTFLTEAGLPWLFAVGVLVLHFATSGNYGIFRDELYFIACGKHLAWGYVDQPPLVPFLTLFAAPFGYSLFALHFIPAIAGAATVYLSVLIARQLSGGRFSQVLTGIAVGVAPVFLGNDAVLTTDAFEPLAWTWCAYLILRIISTGNPRLWIGVGLVAGVAMLAKYSLLFFLVAALVGLLATKERRILASPWMFAGAGLALVIVLPSIVWQYQNGWPIVELLRNGQSGKNVVHTPLSFFDEQALFVVPGATLVWLIGLFGLFLRREWAHARWLAIAYVALFAYFTWVGTAKWYYLMAAYPPLLAAGSAMIESWVGRRKAVQWVIAGLVLAVGFVTLPFALPVLPVDAFIVYQRALHLSPSSDENHRMGPLPQQYADMFGWENMASTVANVVATLPPGLRAKAVVFGDNYGDAGAIDFYAAKFGLPPAVSGHNNYYLWGTRGSNGEVIIRIGDSVDVLKRKCQVAYQAATIISPYAMPYETNLPVNVCLGLKVPLANIWPSQKHYD